ncbi:MAG TPA: isocitrate lyase/phosphoenolpyruvate mutase family protein [Chryseolinea sp.]|nr:isocitrate lyase/phosphoenolpyruvate mutase family protein [Chryseolinea sp.]
MKSKFEEFKALHQVKELFVLPNAWDAKSAIFLQEGGFKAIGTSSAAVAASLGYDDGEAMPFDEYLVIIRRIAASVRLPVTIDLEMGYGKTKEAIYSNIQKLLEAGVIGINLEDSVITNSKRSLGNAAEFASTISYLKEKLLADGQSLFINVRSDTYLLKTSDARTESTRRAKLYKSAGADGLFLPFIVMENDIEEAVTSTNLPLNVMCLPGLPDLDKLQTLGVKRASMGPFLQNKTYDQAKEMATKVIANRNFSSIL